MQSEAAEETLRAQSLIKDGFFERALQHAQRSLHLLPKNATALVCLGICEDALGLHRRSVSSYAKAAELLPEGDMKIRCRRGGDLAAQHLKEQTFGEFDWPELYKIDPPSLFSGEPTLNPEALSLPTASYCHPSCKVGLVLGHGRGILTSSPIEPGTLLFACKAFILAPREQFLKATVEKLRVCPKVEHDRFFCLFDGLNGCEHIAEDLNIEGRPRDVSCAPDELPRNVDVDHVQSILNHSSHTRDAMTAHGSAASASRDWCGIWLLASFVNHSCSPNVERLFVGDMMLCRAVRPIRAGSELFDSYVSTATNMTSRRQALATREGQFDCTCARCRLEACLLPAEVCQQVLHKINLLSAQIDPQHMNKAIEDLGALAAEVESMIVEIVKSSLLRLERDIRLSTACEELFGLTASSKDWVDTVQHRLEKMLCGSFVAIWVAMAFAQELQKNYAAAADTYNHLCKLLEEVCPNSTFHANRALAFASRSFEASRAPGDNVTPKVNWWNCAVTAANYAKQIHQVCYGREVWPLQLGKLGWPDEWTAEFTQDISKQPLDVQPQWSYVLEENVAEMRLSINLPEDVDLKKVSVDMGVDRVILSYCAGSQRDRVETLNLILTTRINPAEAQPARYNRRTQCLMLKAPYEARY